MTGASRGIGAAVARRFAAEGARLILIARTTGGLEEVDDAVQCASGEPATLVPMDLRDGEQIDRLGGALAERFGRLDILVANAGMLGQLSPVGHYAPDDWEETLALNLGANWRLIRSFDPLLRASPAGRAIFVTAAAAEAAPAFWAPTRRARRGWRRWSAAMRPKSAAARSGSTCSTPARWRLSSAAAPIPARTRASCPHRRR